MKIIKQTKMNELTEEELIVINRNRESREAYNKMLVLFKNNDVAGFLNFGNQIHHLAKYAVVKALLANIEGRTFIKSIMRIDGGKQFLEDVSKPEKRIQKMEFKLDWYKYQLNEVVENAGSVLEKLNNPTEMKLRSIIK